MVVPGPLDGAAGRFASCTRPRDFQSPVLHQAVAAGNVDNELACRTKLAAEVHGGIGKLFEECDRYSWHRMTVYGDVR